MKCPKCGYADCRVHACASEPFARWGCPMPDCGHEWPYVPACEAAMWSLYRSPPAPTTSSGSSRR